MIKAEQSTEEFRYRAHKESERKSRDPILSHTRIKSDIIRPKKNHLIWPNRLLNLKKKKHTSIFYSWSNFNVGWSPSPQGNSTSTPATNSESPINQLTRTTYDCRRKLECPKEAHAIPGRTRTLLHQNLLHVASCGNSSHSQVCVHKWVKCFTTNK